ncbi:hypothetical protein MNR01_05635 [Lysobacter sp. S4-A87]|uniref:hypothetical protein n=1 Tax=Lysobacter sp. S4-A87 TaxID=2925843 RepID=UPI001F53675F|nr:hypothetical protein [Lysobacter sp. S4-A87]UNK50488.1 hypothetical protein MNR01_05635 [Lysobacter sp. S4-A87]
MVASWVLLFASAIALASPSNKWRIQVSSDADTDGVVVFRIAPVNGQPVDVSVPVPKNAGENHVAGLIRDAMRAKLGDAYRVEVDDGEDVLVKKHLGDANFELTVVQQTVKGTRIRLDKE